MKPLLFPVIVAGLSAFALPALAQQAPRPTGITQEMIDRSLPEEGAPRAVPGPYEVQAARADGIAGFSLVYPADLSHFPRHDKLPVVLWGNGGCAIDNPRYLGFLETVASQGFFVITTAEGAEGTRLTPDHFQKGLDWAVAENARAGSPFAGKLDLAHVALMGHSCGARVALEQGAADARVGTVLAFNGGLQPAQQGLAASLRGPVLLVDGGEPDFAKGLSERNFATINAVPVFHGSRHDAGHRATFYHAGGGEFANLASNWLRWQLKGDAKAGTMFAGAQCGLCTDEHWDVQARGF